MSPRVAYDRDRDTADFDSLRVQPHDAQVEQGLLGGLLLDNRAYQGVSEFLKPEHFFLEVHQRMFAAIAGEIEQGHQVDAVVLKHRFAGDEQLENVGGASYLADIVSQVVTVLSVPDYGRTIVGLYRRRQMIALAEQMATQGADFSIDIDEQISGTERQLADLAGVHGERATIRSFPQVLNDFLTEIDPSPTAPVKAPRIMTGLSGLDRRLGGLEAPSLVIVGARPSMGKTALGITLAANVAQAGDGVLFFSIETKAEALGAKIVARRTGISVRAMRDPELSMGGLKKVIEATLEVKHLAITIDDDEDLTLSKIKARAIKLKREQPKLKMIVIDYLGLISLTESRRSRDEQLGEVTRGLKKLARRLGVVIVLLAQLSRKVEERDNKRPMLSDLRDSGNIEQDADIVIFPYRHEYYLEKDEPRRGNFKKPDAYDAALVDWHAEMDAERGMAELIVAKCKEAERGTERVRFDGVRQLFEDFAGDQPDLYRDERLL